MKLQYHNKSHTLLTSTFITNVIGLQTLIFITCQTTNWTYGHFPSVYWAFYWIPKLNKYLIIFKRLLRNIRNKNLLPFTSIYQSSMWLKCLSTFLNKWVGKKSFLLHKPKLFQVIVVTHSFQKHFLIELQHSNSNTMMPTIEEF